MKRRRSKATLHKDVLVKRGMSEQLLGDLVVAEQVRVLHGLVRYRFGDNAELMGAWASARNVLGPFKPKGCFCPFPHLQISGSQLDEHLPGATDFTYGRHLAARLVDDAAAEWLVSERIKYAQLPRYSLGARPKWSLYNVGGEQSSHRLLVDGGDG